MTYCFQPVSGTRADNFGNEGKCGRVGGEAKRAEPREGETPAEGKLPEASPAVPDAEAPRAGFLPAEGRRDGGTSPSAAG